MLQSIFTGYDLSLYIYRIFPKYPMKKSRTIAFNILRQKKVEGKTFYSLAPAPPYVGSPPLPSARQAPPTGNIILVRIDPFIRTVKDNNDDDYELSRWMMMIMMSSQAPCTQRWQPRRWRPPLRARSGYAAPLW